MKDKTNHQSFRATVFFRSIQIFLFCSLTVYAADVLSTGWIKLGAGQAEAVSIKASPANVAGMSVSFSLPGFSSATEILDNQTWNSLSFEGQCNTDVVGAPALPLLRRYFAVPPNAAVTVTVTGVTYKTFENVTVAPFQRPLLETETVETRAFAINKRIYSTDSFYPGVWASVPETVIMRGVHLGMLTINPFRYNPVTKTLQVASDISVTVSYAKSNPGTALCFPSNLETSLKALALNYDFMDYRMVPFQAKLNNKRATDYLFIVDQTMLNAPSLAKLVQLHTAQGITVEVKSAAGLSTYTAVMDVIKAAYGGGELDYVLLVGDLPAIPHNTSLSSPSDSWYSWLDGTDKVGDVGLGRLPATDVSELDKMINKTINFMTGVEQGDWRKKSVLIAHKEEYPNKYTACKEEIYNKTYKLWKPTMDRIYGGNGGTNAQVTTAINEGRIVVNYRGHGSGTAWTGWGDGSYTTTTVAALKNGKKTPVVFSMACDCGNMSDATDCLAEAFMCQEQGAVAIVAATKPSMTTVNHTYDKALYNGCWDNGTGAFGDLRNFADAEVIKAHGTSANNNVTMYVLSGDPTVNILKTVSLEPFISVNSPNGGEKWELGTDQVISWGDNIDGNVKIELFKGGSLKEVLAATTASDGSFDWQVPGNYVAGDDYKVKITSIDSAALNDESDANFSILAEYVIKCPYFQNFDTLTSKTETLPFKWSQLTDDDLNWTVLSGPTPSRVSDPPDVTGPENDHTTGSATGKYIYTEASGSGTGYPSKKLTFLTPKFDFKTLGTPTLSFWYHMLSSNTSGDKMGTLALDISVDGTWKSEVIKLSGNKGDDWYEQKLDLTQYKGDRVIFRFRGVSGDSWESDISLDDFRIDGVQPINNTLISSPSSYSLKFYQSRLYYQVPDQVASASLSLKLYDMKGKLIRTLYNGVSTPGYHFITMDKDVKGKPVLSEGIYLCRMEAGNFSETIKMVVKR